MYAGTWKNWDPRQTHFRPYKSERRGNVMTEMIMKNAKQKRKQTLEKEKKPALQAHFGGSK